MSFEEFQDAHLATMAAILWIAERNNFSNSESMSLWCFPSSFSSIWLMVWEEMLFEESRDGRYGHHLGYRNRTILATLNLYVALMPPIGSIWLMVWEEMSFEEFQEGRHGGHLGYRNGTKLAILNLHVATIPPTKFQLNPTYGSGGDVKNVKS